ncbi:hypothetical protein SAMN04488542_101207 [Fontibacillus panacisegetis]|uniref:Uncharacterized protein n=1 Tax=Fontibacillus panacisegetis TaxID=670482 RepID=A0A1G7EHX6_9BACL|nr:hypothetical protein [Fontibacillus panacisegetis]SDE63026.1 hypothetical protein SAMN04488542_101207 [Fontibacillus panacisegetis]
MQKWWEQVIKLAFWKKKATGFSKNSNVRDIKSQKCSRCGKFKLIAFYADEYGGVKGLCKECRKEIEKMRELFPI